MYVSRLSRRIVAAAVVKSSSASRVDSRAFARLAHSYSKPNKMAEETLFEKIVAGKIPCSKVYEDEQCLAFRDISPTAPVHTILVPKVLGNLTQLQHAKPEDKAILGHLLWAAGEVARIQKLEEGYRVVINDGPKGCQSGKEQEDNSRLSKSYFSRRITAYGPFDNPEKSRI
jgi:HIT domain